LIIAISALHKAYFVIVGVGLWLIDLLMRMILVCIYKKKIRKATLTNLPGNIIRLVFEMNKDEKFRYKSGQYVCICIPEISCYEWHPLSISSSPHENEFALHFSAIGSWTKKIQKVIETKGLVINKNHKSMLRSNFPKFNKLQSNASSTMNPTKEGSINYFSRGNTIKSKQGKWINYQIH
jgi:predicted ferric reductase